MAALATALVTLSDTENKRTYYASATHTHLKPRMWIQSRKLATGNELYNTVTYRIICGTADALGANLSERYSAEVTIRMPIYGAAGDRGLMDTFLKDLVQSDEFTASLSTTQYIKTT